MHCFFRRRRAGLCGCASRRACEVGSQYVLPFFTTADACALRLVCREFLAAVSEQPWEGRGTR
jgi:hypothetical protein